jgi:O-acetylhomoserine/O-acetylserine sulfhydrylase-like pyridoxal-dependent enzyme
MNKILPRYGIEVSLVDVNDIQAYKDAVKKNTKVIIAVNYFYYGSF